MTTKYTMESLLKTQEAHRHQSQIIDNYLKNRAELQSQGFFGKLQNSPTRLSNSPIVSPDTCIRMHQYIPKSQNIGTKENYQKDSVSIETTCVVTTETEQDYIDVETVDNSSSSKTPENTKINGNHGISNILESIESIVKESTNRLKMNSPVSRKSVTDDGFVSRPNSVFDQFEDDSLMIVDTEEESLEETHKSSSSSPLRDDSKTHEIRSQNNSKHTDNIETTRVLSSVDDFDTIVNKLFTDESVTPNASFSLDELLFDQSPKRVPQFKEPRPNIPPKFRQKRYLDSNEKVSVTNKKIKF